MVENAKKEYNRKYREDHREQLKQKKHDYYLQNREVISAKAKVWYLAHHDQVLRETRIQYHVNASINNPKRYAKARLETAIIREILGNQCFVCNRRDGIKLEAHHLS